MKKELTCIVCPMGCNMIVELENDKVVSVTGNTCKRGIGYAETEFTDPRRVITTTVKTTSGIIIPVKTNKAVPKDLIFKCMNEINVLRPEETSYSIGDVLCANICDTGADVVVCTNIKGE